MARHLLSTSDDWHLSFPDEHDVRGFRVLDAQRNETGQTVTDMVVDTDAERVSHVVFSDGTEYPAEDLSIGDGVVYATTEGGGGARRTADLSDFGRVGRRTGTAGVTGGAMSGGAMSGGAMSGGAMDAAAGGITGGAMSGGAMDADDDAYRAHHATTYAATGRSYEGYRSAYQYGRDACGRHAGRSFDAAEPDLRADYGQRHGDGDSAWDDVREAVRHGWERARAALS